MSGEATNEIYIFFHFTSEIKDIFNKKKKLNFLFIIYNQVDKERKVSIITSSYSTQSPGSEQG